MLAHVEILFWSVVSGLADSSLSLNIKKLYSGNLAGKKNKKQKHKVPENIFDSFINH